MSVRDCGLNESADTNPPSAIRHPLSDGRRVLGNFFSLSIVQFANYLAPLITLPYLFRVLGPSNYGLTELARAVSVYFLMLTDYGFSLSATQEISVHRDDPRKVSEVFSSVMLLKFLLLILSSLVLSLIVFAVPKLRADWPVYFLSFGNVIGMWLFPIWLFQGLERMKYIPMLNVTAKTLVVAGIFVFIQNPSDYMLAPLLQSAGTILIGLAGLILALYKFPVRFQVPSIGVLKRELANGWHLFLSKMATTLYTTSNVVILGLLTDNTFVAYYAAPDKIVRAAVDGLQVPLSQAIFPHIGRLASQSKQAALRFTAKVAKLACVITLAISAGLFVTAPYLAGIVMDKQAAQGVPVIRVLSLLPLIIALSNTFGVQVMVNFGLKKLLTRILAVAGVLDIILALSLAAPFKQVGVAIASLTTETFVTAVMFVALRKNGLDVFRAVKEPEPARA
jgi:PST family polysaccharide transporter